MMKSRENNIDGVHTRTKPSEPRNGNMDKGYIGFGNLPNQLYTKVCKKGVQFNILLIGDSNSGATTLVNTLFNAKVLSKKADSDIYNSEKISIEISEAILQEGDFKMHLRVLRVDGFGDLLDNSDCWVPLVKCITDRFETYFQAENALERSLPLDDCRIHCCLYLIPPRLRKIDVCTLKAISDHVAVIPVIPKADGFTAEEMSSIKARFLEQFEREDITIYDFSHLDVHSSEEVESLTADMTSKVPFAVVASEELHRMEDHMVRGRKYEWGLVEVDNLKHSDLHALRYLLLCVGMTSLIHYADAVTYRKYRHTKLNRKRDSEPSCEVVVNPITMLESERLSMDLRFKEAEKNMEDLFRNKIAHKMKKLEENQEAYEVKARAYQDENTARREKLDAMRSAFEDERLTLVNKYPSFTSYKNKKDKDKKKSTSVMRLQQ